MSKPAKQTLTERRAEELRLTIALTARDLFIADGNTSATVERICEIVGIAPRTFHRHFPVKEDLVMPLFRRTEAIIYEVLEQAAPDADPVETLVDAFTAEIRRRQVPEFDRDFLALINADPQYRLRWLDWGEGLWDPVTEFLSVRMDLGDDPFLRTLPAKLVLHTIRQAYTHWVSAGNTEDFAEVEALQRAGITRLISGLKAVTPQKKSPAAAGRRKA
ncbi:TetR/AcrR family transcriptional regulator [Nocardia sp. CA-120079]|uniref:TetR/AcrR family transcriptional regulator n=1 Tax=Nocardia sp. CA-120079 TaxID=3239974 RepID=UPI003D9579AA